MPVARRRRHAFVALGFAAVLLDSRNALAHDRSVVVTLEGGTCVAHSALRDAVASRGAVIADDAPVRLSVKIDPRKDGQVGVEIGGQGAHGALAERRFVASSCADATDALGLVIALAGDDAERKEAEAANDPVPAPPAVSPDAPAAKPISPPSPAAPSTPSRFALGIGALGTTFGEGQIGARIGGTLEWRRTWLPWVEASGSANLARTVEGGGGGADPTWITGRIAIAPVGAEAIRGLRVSVFAAADAGALNVSGTGAKRVESRTRPWFAVAAGGRSRWDLGDRWFAGLDVAAVVSLVRDDFVILNSGTAYRVPAVGAETSIFAGAHFP